MNSLKRSLVYEKVQSTNGRVFTVCFVKKDGSDRRMNCRIGVTSYLNGGECCIPSEKRYGKPYVNVYDMVKGDYRVFNTDTAYKIVVDGEELEIVD